jgi:signal transduction protein with GAF and PtsI domain
LGSISALFGEPASRFTSAIERSNMEEGKIATAWAQFGAIERSPSMYIRMRVLPWSNTFVSVGGWDQFQLLLVNQPVVLLVQLNVQEYGRR